MAVGNLSKPAVIDLAGFHHLILFFGSRARLHLTEEKILNTFLEATHDKWIESAYEVVFSCFPPVSSHITGDLIPDTF